MRTIVLNGSPKGNVENCGSFLLARAFVNKMSTPIEIRSIAKKNQEDLFESIQQADNIIIIAPNYIHSIPAGTLAFLYALPPARENQKIGFIVQSGYPESSESEIICRYLARLGERLGYTVLGAIAKGECAGLAIMPERFEKLFNSFTEFGVLFEQTGRFDKELVEKFKEPVYLSKFQIRVLNALAPVSNSFGWNKILKANNAYDKRFDMPYLEKV
jgi:multimeric flavodoxin WrbA